MLAASAKAIATISTGRFASPGSIRPISAGATIITSDTASATFPPDQRQPVPFDEHRHQPKPADRDRRAIAHQRKRHQRVGAAAGEHDAQIAERRPDRRQQPAVRALSVRSSTIVQANVVSASSTASTMKPARQDAISTSQASGVAVSSMPALPAASTRPEMPAKRRGGQCRAIKTSPAISAGAQPMPTSACAKNSTSCSARRRRGIRRRRPPTTE